MQTFLKVAVAGSAPAFLVTCALGAGLPAGDARTGPAINRIAPAPLDAAGTQPSTQPVPAPPIIIDGINGFRG
jgi:hypothetical protein